MSRIAIIGSGISGLTCGHLLSQQHQVELFEANDYIGGHTATVDVEVDGKDYAIDTGFIVFNDRTYPNFNKLLARINVTPLPTEMSFSVHNQQTGLEYNGHTLATLFAQKRNLVNWQFWRFLAEIIRFNKLAKQLYQQQQYPAITLGEFLQLNKFSDFFAEHYILPMGAAIWSASIDDMRAFSLPFFVRFFEHHGLLNVSDRPQWYVLKGGSRQYIEPLIAPFKDNVHLSAAVSRVSRCNDGVKILLQNGDEHLFDHVILACHSDQSLALLDDATIKEQQILAAMPYQNNEVVLHTDTALLPSESAAWASWNYRLDGNNQHPASVTYNMNILQQLPAGTPTFCVTLNQTEQIDPNKILRRFNYAHPVFNHTSIVAQQRRNEICGIGSTHFAGAYWYNGFHEDGVRSALDVCARFGVSL
ncbi:NAD(P)/FAD-dependent oxidoreductase [Shewanella marina]|uniref:NAD(P)/FAD-dependent oxidoreductase n=1 Tax=Shewanella marina TaxID=487319 RepID=UPI00046E787E|nr:FAD-dependent oxidoreductase [Shewanella marina]